MKIARPPDGFRITLEPACKALVAKRIEGDESAARAWTLLLERLKFVAHREGRAVDRFGKGCRTHQSRADSGLGWPKIVVICSVSGDQVRIKAVHFDP